MDIGNRPALPSLAELGKDLLVVSPGEVALSLLRPLVSFAAFWFFALSHHYLAASISVAALMFFTYTSTSHDLVHRTLHLSDPVNEILLAFMEALCLRSGHAFRLTHLQHHRRFPHEDDIEGSEPSKGFWKALLCGPYLQIKLFFWAWNHAESKQRRWMLAESLFIISVVGVALFVGSNLLFYVGLVIVGSWFLPLATVWCPHRAEGFTTLEQTRGFRGRIIPLLFFQHTYHLEHHLYPGISSHRWADLGSRLEPHLINAGVEFIQLP